MQILETILNKIGLTTLKYQAETYNYLLDIEKRLVIEKNQSIDNFKEIELKYNKLFNWDLFVPELTFNEYKILIGKENAKLGKEWSELHDKYYLKYHRNQYQSFKLRSLSLEPNMLNVFMLKFSSINWDKIAKMMKESNWHWHDNDKSPTIDELKDCVITLIPLNRYDYIGNATSSGGFQVELYYNINKEPICNIIWNNDKY